MVTEVILEYVTFFTLHMLLSYALQYRGWLPYGYI